MDNLYKIAAAAAGAVISFFTGIPVIMWVLIAMMTLDYVTGLMTGMMGVSSKTEGGKLSSRAAFDGLMALADGPEAACAAPKLFSRFWVDISSIIIYNMRRFFNPEEEKR